MQPEVALDQPREISFATPTAGPQPQARWSLAVKISFYFACSYFFLFCFPFPLGSLPYTGKPAEWYELLWHKIVPWMAKHILHLSQPITIFTNGSGDTRYDYVKALCLLVIAALATIVWSVLDRKKENHRTFHQWLRLYVRLYLGAILLGYGAFKVIPSQFPPMWQWRYLETYGDSSPMGILWTFMSASPSYTIFAGAVEMLGGILLFVPRTVTLGALISIGAMANVFMLNMSYDVPVKLYSFHLLLLSIFLVVPEFRRLARFFVLHRAIQAPEAELHFNRRWVNHLLLSGQLVLGLFFAGYSLYGSYKQRHDFLAGDFAAPAALHGPWAVDEFTVNGQTRPQFISDKVLWQQVIFDTRVSLFAQGMNGKLVRFNAKMDFDKKTFELTKRDDPQWKGALTYSLPATDRMIMEGELAGQKVHINLHHLDGKYLLNTRGFRWVNEFPFNR
jgi:uncharacterized membrane protein YphA (DoxX/SURF4 family)